jgi:dihydroorotate dehydrogenase electron transfer subunit
VRENISTVIENKCISEGIYRMTLAADDPGFTAPGQFAMLKVPEKFLRRPISVSTYDDKTYSIVYRVVGAGTEIMSRMAPGVEVASLTGLGNGYDLDAVPDGAYVIGGGIGIPSMLQLARELKARGRDFDLVLGYETRDKMFMFDEFKEVKPEITVMTEDGSFGSKGLVTAAADSFGYACACGRLAMLKALSEKVMHGQFSLEARMGCGFGACMGCSVMTLDGARRVCKEGPVFDKEAIEWQRL